MIQKPVQVFLDANVIIQDGKPPGGPLFARAIDLVKGGFISVLTTDLTKTEVAKKHIENDYNVIKEMGRTHFRKIAQVTLGVKLPEVNKTEIKDALSKKYVTETEEMFSALEAKTLSIDSVPPSVVFDAYAEEKGFFSGEGKKHQFPDAFIFECLKAEASEKTPIIIVSDDGDYDKPSNNEEYISVRKSIPELFKMLGLEVKAPGIEAFLKAHHDQFLELVNSELNDWGLEATDVEDAYIEETAVNEIELVELTKFGKATKGDDILVIGTAQITANVSYTHPDWDTAIYDSEDKVLIPFEDVSGETEIILEAEFSMSILVDENGEPTEIEDFKFRNDKFVWVELHPGPLEY
ncbi:MAG: DUF4935 domain-containing protein [Proteobacteria bacterium]|nr:DUF4935 domain-containing protein [Pseudomonadota bacterium]